jgi:hypothetical protein
MPSSMRTRPDAHRGTRKPHEPDTACTVAALSAGRLEDSMQMCELAEAEVRDGCRRAESVWMIVMKDS